MRGWNIVILVVLLSVPVFSQVMINMDKAIELDDERIQSSSIRTVHLDCAGNNISEISDFHMDGNYIFILDQRQSLLLQFTLEGAFVRRIGSRGAAPGQYRSIHDFDIDTESKQIWVLSPFDYAVFQYDYEGNFVRKLTLNCPPTGISSIDANTIAIYNGYCSTMSDNYYTINVKGDISDQRFRYPQNATEFGFAFTGGMNRSGNTILYSDMTSSHIYSMRDGSVIEKYIIDLGSHTWPNSRRYDIDEFSTILHDFTRPISYLNTKFFETNSGILFDYTSGNIHYKGLHNTRDSATVKISNNEDKILSYTIFLSDILGSFRNEFVFNFSSESAHYVFESGKENVNKLHSFEQVFGIELTSENTSNERDPILIFWKPN